MTTQLTYNCVRGRHRRPVPRWLALLRLAAVTVAVYLAQAFVVGPFLVGAIGLGPTRAVAGLAIAVLCWRR